jgi:hypothetical protein
MSMTPTTFGSTVTGGPPVILSKAEQLAKYFFDNLAAIDGQSISSISARVLQPESVVRQAIQITRVLLLPSKQTICELERSYGWLVRVSSDPQIVGKAALKWVRYLQTRALNISYGLEAVGYDVSGLRDFATSAKTLEDAILA